MKMTGTTTTITMMDNKEKEKKKKKTPTAAAIAAADYANVHVDVGNLNPYSLSCYPGSLQSYNDGHV